MPEAPDSPVPHACEKLFDLFDGPSGKASLGRLIGGYEAGRVVFLRRAATPPIRELSVEVRAAKRVAHPSLVKVLCLAQAGSSLHVVSEYIAGASLLQIFGAARQNSIGLEAKVSLKIMHDALQAAAIAKQLLKQTSNWSVSRTIFGDTVWVAEFGETLLTEVGVSRLLHGPARRSRAPRHLDADADADVAAAAMELRRLLTDQDGALAVPSPFRDQVMSIIERGEDPEAPEHFQNSEQMAEALARLPPSCLATEGEVGYAVRTLLRAELELQRAKLKMVERSTAHSRGGDDSTRFFKTDAILRRTERITAKPPPPENAERLDDAVGHPAGAPREERAVTGSRISKVQSDSNSEAETRLMFLASPKQQGAGPSPPAAQRNQQPSRDEMTQIFRPLFASDGPDAGGHPDPPQGGRRSDAAPVASMRMLPEWVAQNQTIALNRRPARRSWSARTRADPWMTLSLLLAVLLILVVWLAGSR